MLILAMVGALLTTAAVLAGDASYTEYQVKALFLLNFAKYVDWPTEAFADANAPLIISVVGEDHFGDSLQKAVDSKIVNGRPILIRQVVTDDDLAKCHILFISDSEKSRLPAILEKVRGKPVLTVGESEHFAESGGVIGFVRKDGKIRLEIDLNPARLAGLRISSKLLSVADVVRGKP